MLTTAAYFKVSTPRSQRQKVSQFFIMNRKIIQQNFKLQAKLQGNPNLELIKAKYIT